MKQRGRLIGSLLAPVLYGLLATSALGQSPPEDSEVTVTIDGLCAFPVLVELAGKAKIIELSGGRAIIISPAFVATFTNLDDPSKQEVLGITGAFHETTFANGDTLFKVTGRNLLIGLDPDNAFVVTVGNFTWVWDEEFNFVQPLTGDGRVINVCELLE